MFGFSAFSEVIIQLEQKECEERRKVKRSNERKNRGTFRALLQEKENINVLIYKTKWKDFVQNIKDDNRLLQMVNFFLKKHFFNFFIIFQ